MADDIELIKQRVSIYDLAVKYGAEPKSESGNTIQCRFNPLRDERTSSLVLYPSTNSWNDFGGVGGSVIDFVMQADRISTSEAILKLKDFANIQQYDSPKPIHKEQSFIHPEIIQQIWDRQTIVDMSKHSKEMYEIAPKYVFDQASLESLKSFFDIVKIDNMKKGAFILLRDIHGTPKSLRYRRMQKTDDETGEVEIVKWFVLPKTQSSFAYVHTANKDDATTLIVEGTHDYLTAILMGYNVIALPSSKFKLDDSLLKDKICIFMDDDDGKNFMLPLYESAKCSKMLFNHKEFKQKNGIKESKDFSDYLYQFKSIESFRKAFDEHCNVLDNATFTATENRLKCMDDLIDNLKPAKWMIKGIIPESGLIEIVGASGSYKSFIALNMMFCVSNGIPFHGIKTTQGKVIYIAGEGQRGAKERVKALKMKYGIGAKEFYMLEIPANMMDEKEMSNLASDIVAIAPNGVHMVIFDTLHRNSAGSDENSASDFAKILGNLDTYIKPLSNIIGYIHHIGNGIDAKRRGRGTSSRFGAVDTSIFIESEEKLTTVMKNMKQKDGSEFDDIGFTFDIVDIDMVNEDGEKLYNLVPIMSEDVKLKENQDEDIIYDRDIKIEIHDYLMTCHDMTALQVDIIEHFKGRVGEKKMRSIIKKESKVLWYQFTAERGKWVLKAIPKSNPQPQVITYQHDEINIDSMTELF